MDRRTKKKDSLQEKVEKETRVIEQERQAKLVPTLKID